MFEKNKVVKHSIIFLSILLATASCASGATANDPQADTKEIIPTATEAPMAARVNGEGILLSDYEAELLRFNAAIGETNGNYDLASASKIVLDELINQVLLVQSAAQDGYMVDEGKMNARYDELSVQAGGASGLSGWITDNFFTEESFRRALERDMAAIWMRNRILESIPKTADQIHARQILVRNENEAIAAERRLQVGTDFTSLAFEYDVLTGGDLGWFPAGYLLQPDVETAAFSLQPGQFSPIIPTSYGYHIVYVIERDPDYPLSPQTLLFMQHQGMEKWLAEKRSQSSIEIIVQ